MMLRVFKENATAIYVGPVLFRGNSHQATIDLNRPVTIGA